MSEDRFPPDSRYAGVEIVAETGQGGERRLFLRRRFVAPPGAFASLGEHSVAADERLDQIAARHLEDPQQYWRICDANAALDPDELLVVGRKLRITLPEGLPGPSRNAR